MDPTTIKAVWGFNGTERPGAVYLAAVLAAHAQRGLPAFSIYGHDVQDANDTSIPADVAEKILRFARGAVAAASVMQMYFRNILVFVQSGLMRLRFFAVSLSEFMITKSMREHLHG